MVKEPTKLGSGVLIVTLWPNDIIAWSLGERRKRVGEQVRKSNAERLESKFGKISEEHRHRYVGILIWY